MDLLEAVTANLIKEEGKDKYYYEEHGRKNYVPKEQLEGFYSSMLGETKKVVQLIRNQDPSIKNVKEELQDHLTIAQMLRRNPLQINYDNDIQSILQDLKELSKESEYGTIINSILKERFYYPETMVDLYEAGLMDEMNCCMRIRILSDTKSVPTSDVVKAMNRPSVSKEMAFQMLGEETLLELYHKHKSIKYINYMPPKMIMDFYKSEQIGERELKKCYLTKQDILDLLRQRELSMEFLSSHAIPDRLMLNADDAIVVLREKVISAEEFENFVLLDKVRKGKNISENMIKCYQDGFLNHRQMFHLVVAGIVEEDILFALYEIQKRMQSAILFPEAFEEEFITNRELREYFDINRILKRKEEGKLEQDFFDFYRSIMPKSEDEWEEWEQSILEQTKDCEDRLVTLLMLAREGIFYVEHLRGQIEEEEIIEKADQIEKQDLWSLYNHGILSIEALSIIFEEKSGEIVQACYGEKLEESALELLLSEEIMDYYQKKQLSSKNIVKAYQYDILTIEDLKQGNLVVEEVSKVIDPSWKSEKVKELFLNRLLDYDRLKQLMEKGVITQQEFVQMNQEFDFETAIAEIRDRQVQNEAIAQGEERTGTYVRLESGEGQEKLPNISVESRLIYFEHLGAEDPKPIYRSDKLSQKSALEGYDYIIAKKLGVIIIEKLYEDNTGERKIPAVDNATYILPPVKLIEYLEKSNKQDLRKDSNVRYVNHTANWGRNLLKACAEVNPGLDKKKLLEEHQQMYKLLQEEYQENVRG